MHMHGAALVDKPELLVDEPRIVAVVVGMVRPPRVVQRRPTHVVPTQRTDIDGCHVLIDTLVDSADPESW